MSKVENFSSKSLAHIQSYPVIEKVHDYVLSYSLIQAINTYFIATVHYLNSAIISKLPFIVNQLSFLDNKVDSLVLGNFDKVLSSAEQKRAEALKAVESYKKKGSDFVAAHTKKARDVAATYRRKGEDTLSPYLKPVNDFASSTVDKVLPKLDNAAQKAEKKEKAAQNELANTIEIVNDTYARSKGLIHNKSSQISNKVISTYNSEFDASKEKNYYVKAASASVKTGVTLLKSVKTDYFPKFDIIISSANDAAQQAQAKADEIVSSSDTVYKLNGEQNGSIPVPTSA